jgi:hypothetical protein
VKKLRKKDQGYENQRLGDLAADSLRPWADASNFTINESMRDRYGWDHYYEFSAKPNQDSSSFPLEMPPAALSCKVQVKGTKRKVKSVRIRLSNLWRFVQDPVPCFIVVVRFHRDNDEPEEVYIIHVWDEIITRVLEQVFRLDNAGRQSLHKKSISVDLLPEHKISPPWKDTFCTKIASHTGDDLLSYATRKAQLNQSVGFVDSTINVRLNFQAPTKEQLFEKLAKAGVGLEAIDFFGLQASRTRFGLEIPDPSLAPSDKGQISITPSAPDEGWRIQSLDNHLSDPIELSCRVRSSVRAFPFLPQDCWLLRIETEFLNMVLGIKANKFQLSYKSPDPDQPIKYADFHRSLLILERLSSTKELTVIRVISPDPKKKTFDFTIPTGQLIAPNGFSESLSLLKAIAVVFRELQIPDASQTTVRYLLSKQKEFFLLDAAYSKNLVRVSASIEQKIEPAGLGAIGYFPRITVGDHDYMLSEVVIGAMQLATTATGEFEITVDGRPELLRKWSILPANSEELPSKDMIQLTEESLASRNINTKIFVPKLI